MMLEQLTETVPTVLRICLKELLLVVLVFKFFIISSVTLAIQINQSKARRKPSLEDQGL